MFSLYSVLQIVVVMVLCGFFLKLGILLQCCRIIEYRHKYLNTLHISIRKNRCFIAYTMASPEEPPSVTSGLRVAVQPASPIKFLCDELPNVYVFSADEIFTTLCAPFPNRISHFKILAMLHVYVLCSLLTQTLRFP